jgi:hypothetical protein
MRDAFMSAAAMRPIKTELKQVQAADSVLDERVPLEAWSANVERALARLGVARWRDLAGLRRFMILRQDQCGRAGLRYIERRMGEKGVIFDATLPVPILLRSVELAPVCGVYFLRCRDFVKIGCASNVRHRATNIAISLPYDLEPLGSIVTADRKSAFALEKALHGRFRALRHRGEWFRYSDTIRDFIAVHAGTVWQEEAA